MINHSNCDHPSTRAERAKCRRAIRNGGEAPKATTRDVDFSKSGPGPKASTPRDRDKACDNCGVERISYKGTDPLTGVLRYVGERCEYIVRRAGDRVELEG